MRAANRIEGRIDATSSLAPCGEPAHSRDEVASAIVDRRCADLGCIHPLALGKGAEGHRWALGGRDRAPHRPEAVVVPVLGPQPERVDG